MAKFDKTRQWFTTPLRRGYVTLTAFLIVVTAGTNLTALSAGTLNGLLLFLNVPQSEYFVVNPLSVNAGFRVHNRECTCIFIGLVTGVWQFVDIDT